MCPYVIAFWTQRSADMLGAFPWRPCFLIHISDTSRWPLLTPTRCITHSRTRLHAPAHTHRLHIRIAALSPVRSRPQHSRAVFRVHSVAAAPKIPARRFRLSHRTIATVYMRAPLAAHNPPSKADHADRGGHARRITFPRFVHPRQCACARGGSESTSRVPVVFARSRTVGYCQCVTSLPSVSE
jgi:hypothetical protein